MRLREREMRSPPSDRDKQRGRERERLKASEGRGRVPAPNRHAPPAAIDGASGAGAPSMDSARLVAAPGRATLQRASRNGCWELGRRRCGDRQQRSESSAKQAHRAHASEEGNRQARPESGRHGRGRERRGIRCRVAGHDSGCGLWCRLRRIDVRPSTV
ncbi:unnamed protein product [Ectocarpus sp. 4 AP-2014]